MPRALLAAAVIAALVAVAVLAAQLSRESGHERRVAADRPKASPPRPVPASRRRPPQLRPTARELVRRIDRYRRATWHWQQITGKRPTPSSRSARDSRSRKYRLWVLGLWKRRASEAWERATLPPHKSEWLCIHRYEGAWDDPNAPYYGGLQMDIGFQQTYGAELLRLKGTADKWTPLEQMWVAERAYASQGFSPWPNTARYCGLT